MAISAVSSYGHMTISLPYEDIRHSFTEQPLLLSVKIYKIFPLKECFRKMFRKPKNCYRFSSKDYVVIFSSITHAIPFS